MSLLYKHLRISQIFGANTDVGKTILTTALVRASAARSTPVFYLKPVSTGRPEDADDRHVKQYGASDLIETECLYRYDEPVSPHLAATLKDCTPGSDTDRKSNLEIYLQLRATMCIKVFENVAYVYGDCWSPTLSGITQADSYRPLFLPTVLVGDSKLGGISSTISSYESLLVRGYIIDAVILFRDEYYRNWEYLKPYFAERGVHVSAFEAPPPLHSTLSENVKATQAYYKAIVPESNKDEIFTVVDHLDACHDNRLKELESMSRRTLSTIWWPFVQHGLVQGAHDVTVIDSAYSDFFSVYQPRKQQSNTESSLLTPTFDSSASWWTQAVGHGHPSLALAAARAAGRYGHIIFPKATHLPALNLAERLVHRGPGKGWANRVFFSDDGSTGMEVALKMALRAFTMRHGETISREEGKALGVLGLKGSYHGDTLGAMDACEEAGVYTCEWHNPKGYWFDPPTIGIRHEQAVISFPPPIADLAGSDQMLAKSLGWLYDVGSRLYTPLSRLYSSYIRRTIDDLEDQCCARLAALVLEPLLMGAGGMIFVDPLFQRVLVDTVRGTNHAPASGWSGMPVIFDEVFVGLNRIGMQSSGPLLGVNPDISVNAKILTGGLVPLAVTLTTEDIFNAFLSDEKAKALLHGHSYTAHAVGCEVANEALNMIDKLECSPDWKEARNKWIKGKGGSVWSFWDPSFVDALSTIDDVEEVMTLGCVLAIRFRDVSAGYTSHSAERLLAPLREEFDDNTPPAPDGSPYSIHFRTLGNIAYFMSSFNTSSSLLRSIEHRILGLFNRQ